MKLVHLDELPEVGVSHNPEIKKRVILDKGFIPQLMNFGEATFRPGQAVETHKHDTMYEVFFIQSGKVVFVVNDKKFELKPNDCFTIEPGELHSQKNPFSEPVTWLYFGIATD
jgi:quercetin dioxygenase-like cupin family protein